MNKELLIPLAVVLLSVAFLDPFMVLMPSTLVYMLLVLLLLVFVVFSLLVINETAADEREEVHRAFAGRMAYISGTGVLVAGIVYQVLIIHAIEPLLVITLASMTVAKYASLHYAKKNL